MASARRGSKNPVIEQLHAEPYRFSFVQAVRLLQQANREGDEGRHAIGTDALPEAERVRITAQVARSFAASEVTGLKKSSTDKRTGRKIPTQLTVGFMGLFGPSGVLPHHDTQRIIDIGTKKNFERDFLDVFNHRILSFFYRASVKYRVGFAYEANYRRSAKKRGLDDHNGVTRALYSIAGMGTGGLHNRLEFPDELTIEFAGAFGLQPKNAVNLERMLASVLGLPVVVSQFAGQWMVLSDENRSEMPTRQTPLGQNCALGESMILGDRVWDISGKFRICVGPLNLQQFESLLPDTKNLARLAQIVRLYAGIQFDFDVQLELAADAVPASQLGGNTRLGLNSWLFCQQPTENKIDAVFQHDGLPSREREGEAA
ncbi:MAG: type VI secretion system baseplate subunit TssG [Planctomycetales bacterium]|nr:type VI secretion system baseplate subunit TssG [Planctomycetales bacterium]